MIVVILEHLAGFLKLFELFECLGIQVQKRSACFVFWVHSLSKIDSFRIHLTIKEYLQLIDVVIVDFVGRRALNNCHRWALLRIFIVRLLLIWLLNKNLWLFLWFLASLLSQSRAFFYSFFSFTLFRPLRYDHVRLQWLFHVCPTESANQPLNLINVFLDS